VDEEQLTSREAVEFTPNIYQVTVFKQPSLSRTNCCLLYQYPPTHLISLTQYTLRDKT
jgi:hypothetical protein